MSGQVSSEGKWLMPCKIFIVVALAALVACSTGGEPRPSKPEAVSAAPVTLCTEPRPMVCTMEYRPVCAAMVVGGKKTYPSGCNACADIAVQSWMDAPCEDD